MTKPNHTTYSDKVVKPPTNKEIKETNRLMYQCIEAEEELLKIIKKMSPERIRLLIYQADKELTASGGNVIKMACLKVLREKHRDYGVYLP